MAFQIVRNDITKMKTDAIVNTANPYPVVGEGTDSAIYKAAGWDKVLAERELIGEIPRGQAYSTNAYNLKAKYIIHTVGPKWVEDSINEKEILQSCYTNSLNLALKLKCKSISFPLISSGNYKFPKDEALQIALTQISDFLLKNEMDVYLVVYDNESFNISLKLDKNVQDFINDRYITEESQELNLREKEAYCYSNPCKEIQIDTSLLDMELQKNLMTFQDKLIEYINQKNLTETQVYKKANIDRKLFSKIRCNKNYHPKKRTALALAISLELTLDETIDLLARAEIAFSPSSKFDIIIEYFITNKSYDIYKINATLFKYNQPLLGE